VQINWFWFWSLNDQARFRFWWLNFSRWRVAAILDFWKLPQLRFRYRLIWAWRFRFWGLFLPNVIMKIDNANSDRRISLTTSIIGYWIQIYIFTPRTAILDKTLQTIQANITKLLNIDKTNFVSPSPQFNVVNNAETTFGNIPWHKHRIKISNRRPTQRCNMSSFFLCKNMQFTGQKAEQPASTACLLARKCHWLARKMAANMRNATCARTETSKLPT
jgi:hypothetical protein